MIPFIVLGIVAVAIVAVCLRIDNWSRDFTTNYAKLTDGNTDPELRPLEFPQSSELIAERIETWVNEQSRWSVVDRKPSSGSLHLHLTRTTPLFRFVDDIHIDLVTTNDGCRIEAESQSRLGKGDLGQNPRNLKELMSSLKNRG